MVRNHLLGLCRNIVLLLPFILELRLQLKDLGPLRFDLGFKFLILVLILLFLCNELLCHNFKLFFQLIESFIELQVDVDLFLVFTTIVAFSLLGRPLGHIRHTCLSRKIDLGALV